jgi:hypothetical protein
MLVATLQGRVQVGPLAFKTREEADRQLTVICKEKLN